MMLVQKPPVLTVSQSPLYAYRRHAPAPTVVVHPTRTPGLLTLSKPRPPQRQTLPKSTAAEISDNTKSEVTALPATLSPQQRGRRQVKHTKGTVQNQR